MNLIKTEYSNCTFYLDERSKKQGEYIERHMCNDSLSVRCLFKDNKLHGEYIEWTRNGEVVHHKLYDEGKVSWSNMHNLTNEDRFELALKTSLPFLSGTV